MPDRLAYHEAGHALIAVMLGGRVHRLTIEPDDDDLPNRDGDTQVVWPATRGDSRQFALKTIQVCLAGPVAEMIYTGDPWHPGMVAEWAADWREAWAAASQLVPDERRRLRYLEDVSVQLYRQLQDDTLWAALAALADNLSAYETLDSDAITEILDAWL